MTIPTTIYRPTRQQSPSLSDPETSKMSIIDEPNGDPAADPVSDVPVSEQQTSVPSLSTLRWPVVQALRELGRAASDAEITEYVADALNLTQQQRTEMIPSGQETKLRNRIGWAVHELKQIGALHYPSPAHRALTTLGTEVDEEDIKALRAQFMSSTPSSDVDQLEGQEQSDAPAAWLIRAGGQGEHAELFIENGIAAVGFGMPRDVSDVSSRDEMVELVSNESPEYSDAQIRPRASQLWDFLSGFRRGDLVVMPCKRSSQFALGTVTRDYWYRHDSDRMPHTVSVDWQRTGVPRAVVGQDLLRPLSYRRTINAIRSKDQAWRLQQLLETGRDPGARVDDATGSSGLGPDLPDLVEQFYNETGYSTDAHLEQERLRDEWARKLSAENVASLSRRDLLAYTTNAVDYGQYVDDREGLRQQWIIDLDDAQYDRLLDSIRDLCWGEDEMSTRIDRLVDSVGGFRRDTGTKGFTGIQVSRTLAICLPEQFLPFTSQIGKRGRENALRALGLPEPRGSYGQRLVAANNRLREHLAPYFEKDTIGMAKFLSWLKDPGSYPDVNEEHGSYPESLYQLAKTLLVEAEFLEDIVELLEDKGQVILYGPPGTGKTYLARELAKELAPDESCRALVQFHPSTSYEDFFEGYRPVGTGDDGGIRFELTPGPLARMAQRAQNAPPDQRHVMIIDEINRGNLPRVLGELLFLLEYRDESVQTLYRPEEPFALPENLWFIGTMNTADRSIALVDAALRRRFHFVPFFPDSGPMSGLLDRWLEREDEPAWVGHLVDAVNGELKVVLEGSHLLLGPSHFMKEYGDSPDEQHERLRRIWEYNIEPFIEDQFFGDPDRIERFRFNAVMKRHGPPTQRKDANGEDPKTPDSPEAPGADDAAPDGDT